MIKIEKDLFVSAATNNGQRDSLSNMPWTKGDVAKFVDAEKRSIGEQGNEFVAVMTADGSFVSANALLRRGNGINYQTDSLKEASEKLFDAINSADGLTLRFSKVYKSDNNNGGKTTYYRFEEKTL